MMKNGFGHINSAEGMKIDVEKAGEKFGKNGTFYSLKWLLKREGRFERIFWSLDGKIE